MPVDVQVDRRARQRDSVRRACRAPQGRVGGSTLLAIPSSRSPRTSWSISPIVSRATSSIVVSAARTASGSRSCRRRAAPAWTRMTLIACAAESCRSRAMRVRSSAAARRRSRSSVALGAVARSTRSACRRRPLAHLVADDAGAAPDDDAEQDRRGREAAVRRSRSRRRGRRTGRARRPRSAPSRERVRSSVGTKKSATVGPNGGPTA